MSELWGFASGQREAVQDSQKSQLFDLSLQEGQQGLQEGAVKLEQQKLALDTARIMNARQEQAIKMMQMGQGAQDDSSDPTKKTVDTLYQMANADIASGLLEQGASNIKTAVTLQNNHLKIVDQTTTEQIKRFTFFADLAKDVHDQKSWDQAKMIYQSQFPGQLDPKIASRPYSPDLISQLTAGAQTALQKAQIEKDKAQTQAAQTNVQLAQLRKEQIKAQTEEAKARTAHLEKTGASDVLPKAADVNGVTDLITSNYPDVPKDQARTIARPIAEKAKQYQVDGMKPAEAYRKAFNEAKQSGDFWGLKAARVREGTSAANPMTVPMKDGRPDVSQMKDNMYYSYPAYPGVSYAFDKANNRLVKVTASKEDEPVAASNEEDDEE